MIIIYGSLWENGNMEELVKVVLKDINMEEVYLCWYIINFIIDMCYDEFGFIN